MSGEVSGEAGARWISRGPTHALTISNRSQEAMLSALEERLIKYVFFALLGGAGAIILVMQFQP